MNAVPHIEFLPLGGAEEIGASSFYIRIGKTGVLLDAGLHPRKSGDGFLPKFELIENKPLDFVIISHAHQDHIGAVPFLVKRFPHVQIHCTKPTKDLANLVLHNSLSILKKELPADEAVASLTHEEIDLLVSTIFEHDYNSVINLNSIADPNTKIGIEFLDAGHVLGSAAIKITACGQKILYTGDINTSTQSILAGASLRRMNLDHLLLESTYGAAENANVPSWAEESEKFADSLNRILNSGGSVLIPVFALGKFQEMISLLHTLMEKGKILRTDIYTHGLGKSISRIYDKHLYLVNRNLPELKLREISQLALSSLNNLMNLRTHPGIVLASSGMLLRNTVSYEIAKFFLRMKNFAIFSVGYMDPETPGFWIMKTAKGEKFQIGNEKITVKCDIQKFTFRSHSKNSELIDVVKLTNPKSVHLIHGDEVAINRLGADILRLFPHIKLSAAKLGQTKILT